MEVRHGYSSIVARGLQGVPAAHSCEEDEGWPAGSAAFDAGSHLRWGETEQRLLRLAVNRLGEKGCWDVDELEAEFKELIIADAPIEISGFGFEEIDQVLIGENKDGCEAGDLAPLPGASARARVNDLFLLGSHRLICGDATDPAVVRRLMRTDIARISPQRSRPPSLV